MKSFLLFCVLLLTAIISMLLALRKRNSSRFIPLFSTAFFGGKQSLKVRFANIFSCAKRPGLLCLTSVLFAISAMGGCFSLQTQHDTVCSPALSQSSSAVVSVGSAAVKNTAEAVVTDPQKVHAAEALWESRKISTCWGMSTATRYAGIQNPDWLPTLVKPENLQFNYGLDGVLTRFYDDGTGLAISNLYCVTSDDTIQFFMTQVCGIADSPTDGGEFVYCRKDGEATLPVAIAAMDDETFDLKLEGNTVTLTGRSGYDTLVFNLATQSGKIYHKFRYKATESEFLIFSDSPKNRDRINVVTRVILQEPRLRRVAGSDMIA